MWAALQTFYIWFQTYASPSKIAGMFLYVENKISTSKRISVSNEVIKHSRLRIQIKLTTTYLTHESTGYDMITWQ